jgi:DNA-binding transcriptional regulator YdaS (Cro superfamily)
MDLPTFIRSLAPDTTGAIERAAELFDVKPGAVKAWLYGERTPRPKQAQVIVERSKGKVSYASIYRAERAQ